MQKLNNKGFALAEILVVTVFVMIIFSIIYTNFYPIMAEYERRESYDDVDGKYAAYWLKKIVEKNVTASHIPAVGYKEFECKNPSDPGLPLNYDHQLCENLWSQYGVKKVYITHYDTTSFKADINSLSVSSGLIEYVTYLPNFTSHPGYRIIIEFHRTKDENNYYAYSTMEVVL